MNLIIRSGLAALLLIYISACNNSDKKTKESFFPALSFIQSQVAHVDTSLYSIRKIVRIDSLRNDTTYIRRETFRNEARDFLNIPDIAQPKFQKRYKETEDYDQSMNLLMLTYEPVDAEKEEILRQQVLIDPSGDKVRSIFIDKLVVNKDSSVQKILLWQVDKSFQVTTIKQINNQPETTSTYTVLWNEEDYR